jgi:predicted deacetylase
MRGARFIIRFDDVCPGMNWATFGRFLAFFDDHPSIRPMLGVVPDNRDPSLDVAPPADGFWDRVRDWRRRGWTIAQHGYTHQYTQQDGGLLGIGSKSEFAGLPYDEQLLKLRLGKEILEREGAWEPYFMAPSHAFDHATLRALGALGFEAITDGYGIYPYRIGGMKAVPQLFGSTMDFGAGVYTICLHCNRMPEARIVSLLGFMERNEGRIIDFPSALDIVAPPVLGSVARVATSLAARSIRSVRRLLRR